MKRLWLGLLMLIFLCVAGCTSTISGILKGSADTAATPPPIFPGSELPTQVDLSELLEQPADYDGVIVQTSGIFRRLPQEICHNKESRSPITWALADDDLLLQAAGKEDQVQTLGSGDLVLTVSGRWQQWQGSVGCGRQTGIEELWYLDVYRILSPNPIALVTGQAPAGQPISQFVVTVTPIEPALIGPPIITDPGPATLPPSTLSTATQPAEGQSSQFTSTPLPGSGETAFTTATATVAATEGVTATVVATGTPGANQTSVFTETKEPTTTPPTGSTSTPIAGTTPLPPTIQEQPELNTGSLETGLLEANEIHSWPFVVTTTTIITINVASEIDLDVAITVLDSTGNTIAEQNSAQNGQAEILAGVLLPVAGTFQIRISGPTNSVGNYAILVNDENSYAFVFQGTLNYGESSDAFLEPLNDHFWHFAGSSGDTIVITATPGDGNADLFMRFFGTDGISLVRFHDEAQPGEVEILTFTLPATGLYSLLVGEIEANATSYTIELALG